MKGILRELIGDLVPSTPHPCPHCHGRPEYHDDHDEEQPLVTPSVGDEENTHGIEVAGPSGVWGQ